MERVGAWSRGWQASGRIVLLLDFDGTLAPIVDHPDGAAMPTATRAAVRRLSEHPGVYLAVVSGRGLHDARQKVGIRGIAYAGNHGMEIQGAGLDRVHPEAAAARPRLEQVRDDVTRRLTEIPGAIIEDKGLTLSIHYRLVPRDLVDRVMSTVASSAEKVEGLRLTDGKKVVEVRPDVDWQKGKAVEFLLENLSPPDGTPIIYIGDDRTDEDAFIALRQRSAGEGVIVAESPPAHTAARAFLRSPEEVGELLGILAERAPN